MSMPEEGGWQSFVAAHPEVYPARQLACLTEMVDFGGPDFVAELLDDLCVDGSARAREIAAAVERGDLLGTLRGAHTLKSMGRTLGFERLGSACSSVEEAARGGKLEEAVPHLATVAWELEAVERLREQWNAVGAARW
jgi:HPt (histidine-containing phosphotransfer) domain-containing protein